MAGSWSQKLANPAGNSADGVVQAGQQFECSGGLCVFAAVASAWGGATVTLQFMGPDGATLLPAGAATTLTANGSGVAYLPPGIVTVAVTGGTPTNLFASIARVVS